MTEYRVEAAFHQTRLAPVSHNLRTGHGRLRYIELPLDILMPETYARFMRRDAGVVTIAGAVASLAELRWRIYLRMRKARIFCNLQACTTIRA